jgi:uncharacterized ferritin-like protein (DUF455 family)
MELRALALAAFTLADPSQKVAAVRAIAAEASALACDAAAVFKAPAGPGRPDRPLLIHPRAVPKRSPHTVAGHAALMHSIAHIEFNAINLALDAAWRFGGQPDAYYRDWIEVAGEEALHFSLLQDHLRSLGFGYGDFDAHDGLWTMCVATEDDVLARMALVPRTLEARGLDATPLIQAKLRNLPYAHAQEAVVILDRILADEVGHVAIGNHWFHYLCDARGVQADAYYREAALIHKAPALKPPFNLAARRAAGFSEAELAALPL